MWPFKNKQKEPDKRQHVVVRFHNGDFIKGYVTGRDGWMFDPTALSDVVWLNWEDGTSTRLLDRNVLYMKFEDAPKEVGGNGNVPVH